MSVSIQFCWFYYNVSFSYTATARGRARSSPVQMCFSLCALEIILTDGVSFEQHSSAQTQGLQMASQILPEVLELEIPTDVSVIIFVLNACVPLILFQDICRKTLLREKGQVVSGLLNIINPTLTLIQ